MALSNKGCIKIGSTEFTPKSITPSFESLAADDSGRTMDGTMHINWVLRKIRKLEIEMPPCSAADAAAILNLVQGQEYDITFWDILTNSEMTKRVYTSNSKGSCYSGVLRNGLWQGVSFSAIELAGESS